MHKRSGTDAAPYWSLVLHSGTGVLVSVAGLLLGAMLIGPGVRELLGEPLGFNTDYTSRPAMIQALFALAAALAFAFFILGLLHASIPNRVRRWHLGTANPLTVALGFWIYRRLVGYALGHESLPYEYVGYFCWFYLSIAGSILFAATAYLGSRAVVRVRVH